MMNDNVFSYIADSGMCRADEVNAVCDKIDCGYMLLMYTTGKVRCENHTEICDISHLLEARIFNGERELKIVRSTVDRGFSWRLIDDCEYRRNLGNDYSEYVLKEAHYLDINSKLTRGTAYTSTGGGEYTMPIENAKYICLTNYLVFDNDGIANIEDFALERFLTSDETPDSDYLPMEELQ